MKGGALAAGRKVRVHELAKELGATSKEVLAVLKEQGVFVKSASSTLEVKVARHLRECYGGPTPAARVADGGSHILGLTVADLVGELGVPEKAVVGYLRHLGADVQDVSTGIPVHFAEQARKRFESTPSGSSQRSESSPPKADVRTDPSNTKSPGAPPAPPYFYMQERESSVVHHLDYLDKCPDRTLCGSQNVEPRLSTLGSEPSDVCADCLAKLPEYQALWWFGQFRSISAELAKLRADYRRLQAHSEEQQKHISKLLHKPGKANRAGKKANPPKQGRKRSEQRKTVASPGVARRQKATSIQPPVKRVRRAPDPEVVRKRVQEMNAPRRPRNEAEKRSDEAARESMRSYKPSSWRVGRSPSHYG